MSISTLYNELIKAYSNENLNQVTGKLITLYKSKNYGKIREIANRISKYVVIDEEKDAKCFSKLITLYHPDKGEMIRNKIKTFYADNELDNLIMYSHILYIGDMENIVTTTVDNVVDYNPGYGYDEDQSGYRTFYDSDEREDEDVIFDEEVERSFYNAVKLRMYGDVEREFPSYYLEDFEDFELAESEIEILDGVEFCIHAVTMDLSNNNITDISDLLRLNKLEEIYLTGNQIGYIDVLSNLLKLRVVDLSDNQIDDISPLFELHYLEYVNLIGNPVPESQVEKLQERGIIVTC